MTMVKRAPEVIAGLLKLRPGTNMVGNLKLAGDPANAWLRKIGFHFGTTVVAQGNTPVVAFYRTFP